MATLVDENINMALAKQGLTNPVQCALMCDVIGKVVKRSNG